MSRKIPIACLQTRPRPTIEAALDEALPLAEQAARAGAQILFLPEYCGGLVADGARLCPPAARDEDHPFLRSMQRFAGDHHCLVQVGSLAITTPQESSKIVNRGFMIGEDGDVIGHYDKIHLFDVDLPDGKTYRESDTVVAGRSLVVHKTPKAAVGHTICYDLRFPQLYRSLAKAGAEILSCPAAFTKTTGEAHWHILNRARAIETTRFMVSACAVGEVPGGGESYGHSLIIDPWGHVLADGGAEAGVVIADIDLDQIDVMAARIPSLSNDRAFSSPTRHPRAVA